MKHIILLILIIVFTIKLGAQYNIIVSNYEYSQYRFVGYNDSLPVYQCNFRTDEPIKKAINFDFYQPIIQKNNFVRFIHFKNVTNKIWVHYFDGFNIIYEKAMGPDIFLKYNEVKASPKIVAIKNRK